MNAIRYYSVITFGLNMGRFGRCINGGEFPMKLCGGHSYGSQICSIGRKEIYTVQRHMEKIGYIVFEYKKWEFWFCSRFHLRSNGIPSGPVKPSSLSTKWLQGLEPFFLRAEVITQLSG